MSTARCYFCGHRIEEADVQKTEYHVGHGHHILVMICPACREKKARGEPPFGRPLNLVGLIPFFVILVVAAVVALFVFGMPVGNPLSKPETVVGNKSATSGGLTLTVDRIEKSGSAFRVYMTATNKTSDSLKLPLFGYFKVVDDLGNQYEADPFSSTFTESVAPGATVSGYAKMKTGLKPGATSARVMFTTVFGSFAVNSITVEGVPLR